METRQTERPTTRKHVPASTEPMPTDRPDGNTTRATRGVGATSRGPQVYIEDLKKDMTPVWRDSLLNRYAFPRYWWLRRVTAESRRALMEEELSAALEGTQTMVLGCLTEKGDLQGFALAHHLAWDTRHFGYNIWRLDHIGVWGENDVRVTAANALVEAMTAKLSDLGGECIQARVPMDNLTAIHSLETHGYRIVESLTTWHLDLRRISLPSLKQPERIRTFEPDDTEALVELARNVYTPIPDRFHMDPYLSDRASDELYAEWMRNSCSGDMADYIAIGHDNGSVVGYATSLYYGDHGGRCNLRVGQLMLGAVDPAYRNQGINADMMTKTLAWMRGEGADVCLVGTQVNNIPVQISWQKVGFRPGTVALTLHHWIFNTN